MSFDAESLNVCVSLAPKEVKAPPPVSLNAMERRRSLPTVVVTDVLLLEVMAFVTLLASMGEDCAASLSVNDSIAVRLNLPASRASRSASAAEGSKRSDRTITANTRVTCLLYQCYFPDL